MSAQNDDFAKKHDVILAISLKPLADNCDDSCQEIF